MRARVFTTLFLSACLMSTLLGRPVPASGSQAAQVEGTIIQVENTYDFPQERITCSLRNAIIAANRDEPVGRCPAGNGTDTIRVPVGILAIQMEQAGEDEAESGDLDILESVIIEGQGAEVTIIEARNMEVPDRIFHIHPNAAVVMQNLQIRGAAFDAPQPRTAAPEDFSGGGIYNAGSLRLSSVKFYKNFAAGEGGGIYNSGSLEVLDSRLDENSAGLAGGAISSHGVLVLRRSTFTHNQATNGGAVATAPAAQTLIENTMFTENRSSDGGGAVFQLGGMTIRGSEFWINQTNDGAAGVQTGGNLTIEDSLFNANDASHGTGGVYQTGGRLIVRRTRFIRNLGMPGGGLYIEDTQETRVEGSEFYDNTSYHGAGVRHANGPTTIRNSTFDGNGGYSGGAIAVDGEDMLISNCTIVANNSSDFGGGGIKVTGEARIENTTITRNSAWNDGALLVEGGMATLVNTTVVHNDGIGIGVKSGTVRLQSSIIALNFVEEQDEDLPFDCSDLTEEQDGEFISLGYNLLGTPNGCPWTPAQGDLLGSPEEPLDPQIADLADNNGTTQTHALLPESPAVDAGGPTCLPTDQRGVLRPQGAGCDIGAYELLAAQPELQSPIYMPLIRR